MPNSAPQPANTRAVSGVSGHGHHATAGPGRMNSMTAPSSNSTPAATMNRPTAGDSHTSSASGAPRSAGRLRHHTRGTTTGVMM